MKDVAKVVKRAIYEAESLPDNVIRYTTIDGEKLSNRKIKGLHEEVIRHDYGIIEFARPLTSIGFGAFYGCKTLKSATIPNSVTRIGDGFFGYCTCLTSITIPNSVTSIGDFAFYNCRSLTSITIPNSVESIGQTAFYGCIGLSTVTIPNSVTRIGHDAFYGCDNIQYLEYKGTRRDFANINIGKGAIEEGMCIHCSDGEIRL